MDIGFGNKWESDDTDDEYDEINEVPPPDIDAEFRKNVLSVKHNLYDNTVLKPKLGTIYTHSNKVIADYLQQINHVYLLCLNAQKGQINIQDIQSFPANVREPLILVLNWLSDFFRKNSVPDIIPYEDYIRKNFKEYQFVQDNSFE
jgi:hypothetical protein